LGKITHFSYYNPAVFFVKCNAILIKKTDKNLNLKAAGVEMMRAVQFRLNEQNIFK
jgi:hypothetical protein